MAAKFLRLRLRYHHWQIRRHVAKLLQLYGDKPQPEEGIDND